MEVIVPPYSQYIGAVGAALLVSGLRETKALEAKKE
jgi:activator of 2-hydroxyglutaryl-CoA dehydratase